MTETPDGLFPDPTLDAAVAKIQAELAKCRAHRDEVSVRDGVDDEATYLREAARVVALTAALAQAATAADAPSAATLVRGLSKLGPAAGPLDEAFCEGWNDSVELALDILGGEA